MQEMANWGNGQNSRKLGFWWKLGDMRFYCFFRMQFFGDLMKFPFCVKFFAFRGPKNAASCGGVGSTQCMENE